MKPYIAEDGQLCFFDVGIEKISEEAMTCLWLTDGDPEKSVMIFEERKGNILSSLSEQTTDPILQEKWEGDFNWIVELLKDTGLATSILADIVGLTEHLKRGGTDYAKDLPHRALN